MGLTVHYKFKADISGKKAREQVEALRQKALDLPFKEVGELVELRDKDCDHRQGDKDDPNAWLKIQGGAWVELGDGRSTSVAAKQIIGFTVWPGEGCESAEIGLATYPQTVRIDGKAFKVEQAKHGWTWGAFCKTQYASDPRCGGIKNFLRCHVTLIKLLDAAKELGILNEVHDEGEYWEKRDIKALAKEVGQWNQMLAAFAGQLQDVLEKTGQPEGLSLEAPILEFPDFEHLEAEGRNPPKSA